jgi:hypothetical protein
MKNSYLRCVVLSMFCLFFLITPSFGYWRDVHKKITEKVIEQNTLLLNNSLKKMGFTAGYADKLKGNSIADWITEGSKLEDENVSALVVARYLNHFYDPISNQGLSDTPYYGTSSYKWASDDSFNEWSWKRARDFFYDGLTKPTQTERDNALANTFRAVGQVMHLVQDIAVPAHVRNDAHPAGDIYEKYTARVNVNDFMNTSISFPSGYISTSSGAPRYFWDTDTYTGSSVPTSDAIGLAEYTNANFFSEDTIFSSNYPHPTYADTTYASIDWKHPEITDAEDGKLDSRIYIRKTVGEADARMASMSYISRDCIKKGNIQFKPWILDEAVHNDYASLLIPRAVGYSAGLLNYFFRGSIDITLPSSGVYSVIADPAQSGNGFTQIKLKAQNTTPNNEQMTNGSIKLVVKYKVALSDPFHSDPAPVSADFSYIVVPEANDVRSISRDNPVELTFDLTNNAIPLWATDVYLQVVYHGRLGNEDGPLQSDSKTSANLRLWMTITTWIKSASMDSGIRQAVRRHIMRSPTRQRTGITGRTIWRMTKSRYLR